MATAISREAFCFARALYTDSADALTRQRAVASVLPDRTPHITVPLQGTETPKKKFHKWPWTRGLCCESHNHHPGFQVQPEYISQ